MKYLRKFSLFFCVFAIAVQAYGAEVFLAKATNDEDSDVTKLYVQVDENSDVTHFHKKTYNSAKTLVKEEAFDLTKRTASIVLEQRDDRKILTLQSSNFSTHNGGNVELVYLYNGISGSTGSLALDLERNGDDWALTVDGKRVKHLHLVSNRKWMVGTIGIKYIKIVN